MHKLLTSGLAAVTAAASLGAVAAPAEAAPWHGGGGGWHGGGHGGFRGGPGWGIAGLAALGLTAAIVSENRGPYYGYGPGYYGPGYDGPGYGPATCVGTRRVWSSYYRGYVVRRFYYAC